MSAHAQHFRPTPVFRQTRRRRLTRVTLCDSSGMVQDIMVRDVSAQGLSAVAALVPPALDTIVSVTLPDGRALWGVVRWVAALAFGVEFDTEL